MTNVHDAAHQLAKAIKDSTEYQELKQKQEQVEGEETSKRMLNDFRQLQMELQIKQMQGQQLTQEEQEKAQRIFETIQLNPTISQLMQAEQRFSVVMEDLQNIISEPLRVLYPEQEQE